MGNSLSYIFYLKLGLLTFHNGNQINIQAKATEFS